jgi:hypothetical protein
LDRAEIFTGFPEAVFLGSAMELLLYDVYVLSDSLKYWLTRSITFDPTIGSRLNFYKGFQRQFCLG